MLNQPPDASSKALSGQFVEAVSGIFECLGRALVCLNPDFQVIHASRSLDAITFEGASRAILDRPVEEVMGTDLFGPEGSLRRALSAGERREGWGASLTIGDAAPRMMSVTAAPVHVDSPLCDPRVAYLLVIRGSDDVSEADTAMPTMFSGIVARSAAMLRIFRLIQNLDESEATVLLTGDSGTGKELVARAIHLHSPRRDGAFVAVNCGALPGDLLESELFGHVRGAFTGAVRDRKGRFELARGGTLFLDEVGDLSLPLQVKLLRVLQERTFERVGESVSVHTDARIIAATNLDLQRAVLEGRFRDDLYYRLRVVPIAITPLRDRREDIEPLARHLLGRVSGRNGRSMILGPDAIRAMLDYAWPGNVREMENALEYAVAVCKGQTIHAQDLPGEVQREPGAARAVAGQPEVGPSSDLDGERERIRSALDSSRWNRAAAAKALGISRTTLWRKMREFDLSD
jgi:transcriptional regulator with PAS, ATPase and Fis domain